MSDRFAPAPASASATDRLVAGRVALVTGAGRGIGLATGRRSAESGAAPNSGNVLPEPPIRTGPVPV